jgi:hypothetical protein
VACLPALLYVIIELFLASLIVDGLASPWLSVYPLFLFCFFPVYSIAPFLNATFDSAAFSALFRQLCSWTIGNSQQGTSDLVTFQDNFTCYEFTFESHPLTLFGSPTRRISLLFLTIPSRPSHELF